MFRSSYNNLYVAIYVTDAEIDLSLIGRGNFLRHCISDFAVCYKFKCHTVLFFTVDVPHGCLTGNHRFLRNVVNEIVNVKNVSAGENAGYFGFSFTVTIPPNCTANVRLPDGSQQIQNAGTMTYATEV